MESHSIFLTQTTKAYINIIKQIWKQNRKTLIRPLFYLVLAQPWVKFLDCDYRLAVVLMVVEDNLSVVCYPASAGARCHLVQTMTKIANYWQTGSQQRTSETIKTHAICRYRTPSSPHNTSPLSSVAITHHSRRPTIGIFCFLIICINSTVAWSQGNYVIL